ncbi:MAG: hypothetical protein PWP65_1181 [Clostridia bacterium]|nr:hypothetical protein [Clostridia bacterium]
MALKLGAATFSYLWKCPLEESFKALANMGYRYIEIPTAPPHFWPRSMDLKEREAIRKAAAKNGLEIVAINPTGQDLNLASTNPGIYEETIVQLKEQIKLAHDLGAKVIVFPGGRVHSLVPAPVEKARQLVKEALERCVEDAEKFRVVFGLENVPFSFLKLATDLISIIKEINSPFLGITYDIPNAFMVEDPIKGLEEVAPYLALVHVSDTTKKSWGHMPIGTGEVDFAAVARKLIQIGYKGITILEVTQPSDPESGIKASTSRLELLGWER